MIKVYFAQNLEYLRKAHKMSQGDLGKLVGKTHTAIYKWENGLAEPRLAEIALFAQYFNVPVAVLIYEDITQTEFAASR